jgi:hypothetical protein
MGSLAAGNKGDGFPMRKGRFIRTLGDQGIIDVGDRHNPAQEGNTFSVKAFGIARAVPFFMVSIRNFLSKLEETVAYPFAKFSLRRLDCVSATGRMLFHFLEFIIGQLAGFAQDAILFYCGLELCESEKTHCRFILPDSDLNPSITRLRDIVLGFNRWVILAMGDNLDPGGIDPARDKDVFDGDCAFETQGLVFLP